MPNNKGSRLGPVGLYLLLGVLLFGGVGVGLQTAKLLAPGSAFAQLIGVLMLPVCLAIGMSSWYSAASAQVWTRLTHAMFDAFEGQDFKDAVEESMQRLPLEGDALPGTFVFIPVSLVVSLIAGTLIGLTATSAGLLTAVAVMAAIGLGYGVLLRVLARHCLLPIPA